MHGCAVDGLFWWWVGYVFRKKGIRGMGQSVGVRLDVYVHTLMKHHTARTGLSGPRSGEGTKERPSASSCCSTSGGPPPAPPLPDGCDASWSRGVSECRSGERGECGEVAVAPPRRGDAGWGLPARSRFLASWSLRWWRARETRSCFWLFVGGVICVLVACVR